MAFSPRRGFLFCALLCALNCSTATQAQTAVANISLDPGQQSVASRWVSEALLAVSDPAGQGLGPTGASRAYGILGTAMYDAWSAYESVPVSTTMGDTLQQPFASNTLANKQEAISYAAYTVLTDLFPDAGLVNNFRAQMNTLGYNPDVASTDAANVGVTLANSLLTARRFDGANQTGGYTDTTGYTPLNLSSTNILQMDAWTPEYLPIGNTSGPQQSALHPHWGQVTPFAISSASALVPPAPEPFLLDPNATADLAAGTITRAGGTVVPISRALIGTDINPAFITQTEQVIDFSANLSDREKLIAEFWEDPSGTPYPPGTWMFFGQKLGESVNHDLDADIVRFFGLGNAVMDAGVSTWEAKYEYDYARPVRVVRELGRLGLIGTENSEGEFVVEAWGGVGLGPQTLPATEFLTYQTPDSNPSPPFPEYTSGHSAFSAAAAEFLQLLTGSDAFLLADGSIGVSATFAPGDSRFEPGVTPDVETTLTWLTFSEAADEAGISRLYGGIHFSDGDLNGRSLGASVGGDVYNRIQYYLLGAVPEPNSAVCLSVLLMGLGGYRGGRVEI